MYHKSIGCALVALSAFWGWNAPVAAADDLFFYSSGIDGMLVDPKDRGLATALRLLDERIAELPAELGHNEIPAPAIELLLNLLMNPMTLRGGAIEHPTPEQRVPMWAQLSFHTKDKAAADEVAGRVAAMIGQMGPMPLQPVDGKPGLQKIDMNGVSLFLGTGIDGATPSFVVAANTMAEGAGPDLGSFGLPQGVRPSLAMRMDYKFFRPIMDMTTQTLPPEMRDSMRAQWQAMGLVGDNPPVLTFACGQGGDRSFMTARMTNYAAIARQWGVPANDSISASDLKLIPADATSAYVSKFDLGAFVDAMVGMVQDMPQANMPPDQDPMDMVAQLTGIHPKRDLLDHLGSTMGCYSSDTTGGGLFGSIAFIEVTNAEGLQQTLNRLAGLLNEQAAQNARGYVRLARKQNNGREMMLLTFPGLPIPLEISFAQAAGHLFVAASPQALTAAMDHASSGKTSLVDHPQFKSMGGGNLAGAIKLSFMDTPRLMKSGYGLVSMGMAALSNVTRSPRDGERDAGFIMPSYHDLAKGAVPSLSITRMIGDDIVMDGQGDRSLLVNACGAAGSMGGVVGIAAIAGLFGGISMPAMARARQTAVEVQEGAELRNIAMAMIMYANDNNNRLPASVDALVEGGYIDGSMVHSSWGAAPDDGPDMWIDTSGVSVSTNVRPDERIVAYDRTMLFMQSRANVAFLDGHVQVMSDAELRQVGAKPANAGVDLQLP